HDTRTAPDTHSLPTRRSSDLSSTSQETTAAQSQESSSQAESGQEESQTEEGSQAAQGQPEQTEPLLVYLNDFDGVIGDMFKEATDRKSTRLNSSHVSISYAVF